MKRRRASSGKKNPARGASGVVYPLSLCMIVRNEERFLADALASVQGVVDEICIVDTGSTDGTVAIAESFGARISFIAWQNDFSLARNAALGMATGAWILVLDADERLAPQSREELRSLHGVPPDGEGRWIQCRNVNDAVRQTVATTNAIVRIFPNDPAIRYRGALHEFIARTSEDHSLAATRTGIEIVHLGYLPELLAERGKRERNFALSRADLAAAPNDPAVIYNYAMSALLAGERAIAVAELERVVALTENTRRGFRPMALTTLAGLYLDERRAAEALALTDACIAIVPSLPDGHYVRGRALAAAGRAEEARAAFRAALAAGEGVAFEHFIVDDEIAAWKAHNEIGRSYVAERRFDDAALWFERGLVKRPAERTLLVNRALCREQSGDPAGALADYRAIFEQFADETSAIEYVNFVMRHDGPDVVRTAVEAALPVLTDDYRRAFLASAAAVMLRAQRRDEAKALIRQALSVGEEPGAGRGVVRALAEHYHLPELAGLLDDGVAASG